MMGSYPRMVLKLPHYKNKSELLVEIALLLLEFNYLSYQCLGNEQLKTPIRILAIGLMLISVFLNIRHFTIPVKLLFYMLLCSIPVAIGGLELINWLVILISVVTLYTIDSDRVSDMIVRVSTLGIVLYILFFSAGLINSYIYVLGGRIRNTLGFVNVNAAALFFFSWAISVISGRKRKIITYLVVACVLLWCVLETDTRSILGAILVYLATLGVLNLCYKGQRRYAWKILSALILLLEVFVFVLPFFYPLLSAKFPALDVQLSYRPTIGAWALQSMDLINWFVGGRNGGVDNTIIMMLMNYGLVVTGAAAFFVVKATWNLLKCYDLKKIALIVSLWCMSTVESFLYRPEIMITVLFWHYVFKTNVTSCQRR